MLISNKLGKVIAIEGVDCIEVKYTYTKQEKSLLIALSPQFRGNLPERARVFRLPVGQNVYKYGKLMLLPEKELDNRVFLIDKFDHVIDKISEKCYSVDIDHDLTTAVIINKTYTHKSWNFGVVFFAILKPGEYIVSTCYDGKRVVRWNENGKLKQAVVLDEAWETFKTPDEIPDGAVEL